MNNLNKAIEAIKGTGLDFEDISEQCEFSGLRFLTDSGAKEIINVCSSFIESDAQRRIDKAVEWVKKNSKERTYSDNPGFVDREIYSDGNDLINILMGEEK